MDVLIYLLGLPLIIGVVIAGIEWRRKTIVLKHDMTLRGPSTETGRDIDRAAQALREAHLRNSMKDP